MDDCLQHDPVDRATHATVQRPVTAYDLQPRIVDGSTSGVIPRQRHASCFGSDSPLLHVAGGIREAYDGPF